VKGTVLREDKPIDNGQIMFAPTGSGPAVLAEIKDGKFDINKQVGPIPGSYKVTISQSQRRIPEVGVPEMDWNTMPEDRFKGAEPQGGWKLTAEIKKGQSDPIEFKVGEN